MNFARVHSFLNGTRGSETISYRNRRLIKYHALHIQMFDHRIPRWSRASSVPWQSNADPTNGKASQKAQDRVVQREILRHVYDSYELSQIENILLRSGDGGDIFSHIDEETALGVLCYMADHVESSNLFVHDEQVCDNIVKTLCETCIEIETCSAASLGMLLWALEVLPIQGATWRRLLLIKIATRECSLDNVSHYSTRELTNIIVACGHLSGYHFDNDIDRRVMRYLELLFRELSNRIEKPHVRSAFGGSDFADLAQSSALLYESCYAQRNSEGCHACGAFLKNLSSEVKRKLANRHSSSSKAFNAVDLKRFLFSYVKISMISPDAGVPDMLDQVASYVSGQMKELATPYTMQDLAAILEFFAFYKRSSLAIFDLFSHSGMQIRLLSLAGVVDSDKAQHDDDVVRTHQEDCGDSTWLAALTSIMMSHIRLGFRPTDTTLISTLPAVQMYSKVSEAGDNVELIRVFELFDFHCGDALRRELLGINQ